MFTPLSTSSSAKQARNPRFDPFERQADQVANQVVKGQKVGPLSGGASGVQAKAKGGSMKGKGTTGPGMGNTSQGMGRGTLTQMNRSFGHDFSSVRIHTGAAAGQQCEQLGARAFTYGRDIYFNQGEYQPQSSEGQHLLAHELTHVLQQNALESESGGGARIQKASKQTCESIANYPELQMSSVLAMIDAAWESSKNNEKFTDESLAAYNERQEAAQDECLTSESGSLKDCPDYKVESWDGRESHRNSKYRETSFYVMPDGSVSPLSKSELPWKVSINVASGATAVFHSHPTEKSDVSREDAAAYRQLGEQTRLFIINRNNIQLLGGSKELTQIVATFKRKDLEKCLGG